MWWYRVYADPVCMYHATHALLSALQPLPGCQFFCRLEDTAGDRGATRCASLPAFCTSSGAFKPDKLWLSQWSVQPMAPWELEPGI